MILFITKFCLAQKDVDVETDGARNLFITKNTTNPDVYPCLIAHMDEVPRYTNDREIVVKKDKIFGRYVGTKQQCGLGADDKNGIYIALHLLTILPNMKICFTTEEEVGCIGARTAAYNLEFFQDCQFLIEPDRRGANDLITRTNGLNVTSKEFLDDVADIMKKYKFSEAVGTMTDIGDLVETTKLSAVNVSCGYYNAHTHQEYTKLSELQNTLNFIYEIVTLNNKAYPHVSTSAYAKWGTHGNHYSRYWDRYDDWDDGYSYGGYGYRNGGYKKDNYKNGNHNNNYQDTYGYNTRNQSGNKSGNYSSNLPAKYEEDDSPFDKLVDKCNYCRDYDCMNCSSFNDIYGGLK